MASTAGGRGDDDASRPAASEERGPADRQKPYQDILAGEIAQGLAELDRPARGLVVSGLSAGLDIGFSVLLMATFLSLGAGGLPHALTELILANMYAAGFVFVVLGRSELFTEHTTMGVYPVLARRAGPGSLARLWGIVWAANLVGAAAFSWMAAWIGPELGMASAEAFEAIAIPLVDTAGAPMLMSAVLAGWLMGLLSWLLSAARDSMSRILFVWLVTAAIGFLGLHHSILGSVEVLAAVFVGGAVDAADYGRFLAWSTLGNAIGGAVFVALIKYSHAMHPGSEPRMEDVAADVTAE